MTKTEILATLTLLTGLHFTSPQPALASINIHAFGPDNVAHNIKASKCKLAFDGENHFKPSQNFYSLHIYSHDGTCLRFKRLETQCRPSFTIAKPLEIKHTHNLWRSLKNVLTLPLKAKFLS
ncbi:MAG: hypothetical protein VX154_00750 [Pseudomonadota bacterium]|nr:hypothetical protein [Pseudomonadota bacterium]